MTAATARTVLNRSGKLLDEVLAFDAFLAKLSPKDRLNVERHLTACEQGPGQTAHADLWRRLARVLMTLAPHSVKTAAQQTVQYFIADGKYRMQVFAVEDLRDGKISVFASDVLDDAVSAGVIDAPGKKGTEGVYPINARESLNIERLDGRTPNPSPFYKDMLGWNRRAIRIILPVQATPVQIKATEQVCALAADKLARPGTK